MEKWKKLQNPRKNRPFPEKLSTFSLWKVWKDRAFAGHNILWKSEKSAPAGNLEKARTFCRKALNFLCRA